MSVAAMLGVDEVDGPMMMAARNTWARWRVDEPALAPVESLLDLPGWTCTATRDAKDAALRALAKLGAPDAGNDEAATTALVWALLPGAAQLAVRLSDLSDDVDALVGAQLWIAAKTFAWRARASTAATILRDTRRAVLCELGVGDPAHRQDRAWANATRLAPDSPVWQSINRATEPVVDPAFELAELLVWAKDSGVVDEADIHLLMDLAVEAQTVGAPGGYGRGGLMGPAPTEAVAARWGVDPRTVRRRARRTILRLAALNTDDHDDGRRPGSAGTSLWCAGGAVMGAGDVKNLCRAVSIETGLWALGA